MVTELDFNLVAEEKIKDNDLLRVAVGKINGDPQSSIPLLIRLLENPQSPIALPGKIDLYNHDCLHLLLDRGVSLADEAFIIGFTMGNDDQTNDLHVGFFKFCSKFLYPQKYRFKNEHLYSFDLGFLWGKKLAFRNINKVELRNDLYQNLTIVELREHFGLDLDNLKKIKQVEDYLLNDH